MMKHNMSALMVGTVALLSPTLSFAIIQTIIPYSVSARERSNGPDFSNLSLSVEQQTQLLNIQTEMKPQVMKILTKKQKTQLEAKLTQGQSLFQGVTSLNLSGDQKSKLQGTMKSQMFKIISLLTPEQQEQLIRSEKPPV